MVCCGFPSSRLILKIPFVGADRVTPHGQFGEGRFRQFHQSFPGVACSVGGICPCLHLGAGHSGCPALDTGYLGLAHVEATVTDSRGEVATVESGELP